MKKSMTLLFSVYFVLSAFGQGIDDARKAAVTNYQEVVSKIEYPIESRLNSIEGKVLVSIKIDENGEIMNYKFTSYPCTNLKLAVEKALDDFTFEPAVNKLGQRVPSRLTLPVVFELTV